VPRESLDAAESLPKETSSQVTFGELQSEVPGMPDEASAGLERALLQARQRPVLDGVFDVSGNGAARGSAVTYGSRRWGMSRLELTDRRGAPRSGS
jgi:hypothetical protein